jgi:hypothetical protein
MQGNALRCDVDYRVRRGFFVIGLRDCGAEGVFLNAENGAGDECVK